MSLARRVARKSGCNRDEFRLLRDLVNGYAGIYFGDEALQRARAAAPRATDRARPQSFGEYYQFLRLSSASTTELDEAVELLTTNETYFFREDYQLRAFRDEVLPDPRGRKARRGGGCRSGARAARRARRSTRSRSCSLNRRCSTAGTCGSSGATSRAAASRSPAGASTGRRFSRDRSRASSAGYFIERRRGQPRHRAHPADVPFRAPEPAGPRAGSGRRQGRRHLLPQRPHLLRRALAQTGHRDVLRAPGPRGVSLLGHSESLLNVSTAFELFT